MKKICLVASLSLVAAVGFSQSKQNDLADKLKDPKTIENAAKADTSLINMKQLRDDGKKKKPRREKSHKECSRMKS